MKVSFLGTGTSQGVPVITCKCDTCLSDDPRDKRLRTSLYIQSPSANIVIDTGPDFRQQMLRQKVEKLDAVLYTHEHRDHIAGLDDIRAFNFSQNRAMDIYTEDRVFSALKYMYPYIFAEKKYPGAPRVDIHLIEKENFKVGELNIQPIRVMHYRLPVLGFRIGELAYITDANFIAEEEKEKLFGVKYLIVNALRKEKHVSHFTLSEAIEVIQEISPKRAFITHISHLMGKQQELEKELPENIMAAYDGYSFDV